MRITVDGRPVADLVPIEGIWRTFVPKDDVMALLQRAPLDRNFVRDLERVGATIDEL
jgi:antitoxin (DNA-binding transcriptional repressor) of toxin-antitoxin stability system